MAVTIEWSGHQLKTREPEEEYKRFCSVLTLCITVFMATAQRWHAQTRNTWTFRFQCHVKDSHGSCTQKCVSLRPGSRRAQCIRRSFCSFVKSVLMDNAAPKTENSSEAKENRTPQGFRRPIPNDQVLVCLDHCGLDRPTWRCNKTLRVGQWDNGDVFSNERNVFTEWLITMKPRLCFLSKNQSLCYVAPFELKETALMLVLERVTKNMLVSISM